MTETTDATAIFAPIWRRKWLILAVAVIVAVAAYIHYKRERPTFSASTQVDLAVSSEEAAASEAHRPAPLNLSDQSTIIKTVVSEEVHRSLRRRHLLGVVRGATVKAKGTEKSSFITISAEAHTKRAAELLANEVAVAYIHRRNLQRERSIEKQIALTRRQLRRVEAANATLLPSSTSAVSGAKGVPIKTPSAGAVLQQANLTTKIDGLEESLAATGAEQIKPAHTAELLSPQPKKDAIFGFVIGLVLAAIAAYILSRFDRRLRTLDGIESMFRVPVLTALPKVARPLVRRDDGQPAPSRQLLEPVRRLYTSLQLGPLADRLAASEGRRVILFLSPDPGDGRSTAIADLGLVQRDSGERVTIVEANFRRPIQARLLGVPAAPSLEEVLAGTLTVEEARRVPTAPPLPEPELTPGGVATALATRGTGSLFVLAGSQAVTNPPALMASESMAELLRTLGEESDYVLVDAPSPLEVSDALPLLRVVDGIVLVARAGYTREASAHRLMQLLVHNSSAPVLGTVANCVTSADIARHGLSAPVRRSWLSRLPGS